MRVTPRSLMRCESSTLILGFIGPWSLAPLLKCVYNDDAVIFHCRFFSHWKWVISRHELVLAALWGRSEPTFTLCGCTRAVLQPAWCLLIDAPLIYYLPSAEHVFKCGDTGEEGPQGHGAARLSTDRPLTLGHIPPPGWHRFHAAAADQVCPDWLRGPAVWAMCSERILWHGRKSSRLKSPT